MSKFWGAMCKTEDCKTFIEFDLQDKSLPTSYIAPLNPPPCPKCKAVYSFGSEDLVDEDGKDFYGRAPHV